MFLSVLCAVIQVGEDNLREVIGDGMKRPMFLKLWARYCFHCREFQPVWEELGDDKEFEGKVDVGEIDCEVNRKVCGEFPGSGVPRLFWIENGEILGRYEGEKTLPKFRKFAWEMLSLPLILVDDVELANESFLFSVPNGDDSLFEVARSIAREMQTLPCKFYLKREGVKVPKLSGSGGREFRGKMVKDEIIEFIKPHVVPFMTSLSFELFQILETMNITFLTLIEPVNHESLNKASDLLPVVSVNCTIEDWFCTYIRYSQARAVIMRHSPRTFWVWTGRITPESMSSWTKSVLSGKITGVSPKSPPSKTFKQNHSVIWMALAVIPIAILPFLFRRKQKQE